VCVCGTSQFRLYSKEALPVVSTFVQPEVRTFVSASPAVYPASVCDVQRGNALLRICRNENLNSLPNKTEGSMHFQKVLFVLHTLALVLSETGKCVTSDTTC
jgi:hypothetical protein